MDQSERVDEGKWSGLRYIQEEAEQILMEQDGVKEREAKDDSWFLTLMMGWWNHYGK